MHAHVSAGTKKVQEGIWMLQLELQVAVSYKHGYWELNSGPL